VGLRDNRHETIEACAKLIRFAMQEKHPPRIETSTRRHVAHRTPQLSIRTVEQVSRQP